MGKIPEPEEPLELADGDAADQTGAAINRITSASCLMRREHHYVELHIQRSAFIGDTRNDQPQAVILRLLLFTLLKGPQDQLSYSTQRVPGWRKCGGLMLE